MPEKPYLWEFHLVDPIRLASTSSVAQSTVRVITGLVQVTDDEWEGLSPHNASRLINPRIVALTHYKTRIAQFTQRAAKDAKGGMTCYYCSRCGRRFVTNEQCKRCGITFAINTRVEVLTQHAPIIPHKVVVYATDMARHQFAIAPPRT